MRPPHAEHLRADLRGIERSRHKRWFKHVRAAIRRLPWKRARQEARRDIAQEATL